MSVCILWQGRIDRNGYPRRGRNEGVHRTAYEERFGLIPSGFHVHHECGNRSCVNPDHLSLVTPSEHARRHRAWESPHHVSKVRRAWTHCSRGHEYTPENTRVNSEGERECRTCQREKMRAIRAANYVPPVPKTHCPHGHEYVGENLIFAGGVRRCRTCRRAQARAFKERRKAATA